MNLISLIQQKLLLETLITHVVIVAFIVYLLLLRKKYPAILQFVKKYAMWGIFLTALASVVGSLFYSNIVGYAPCELCWLQRIFMYPLVVLFAVALIKKEKHIIDYALPLSFMGAAVSLYHNYIYYIDKGLDVYCNLGGAAVSCVKRYVFGFGYITIPLMALTAFVVIIILLFVVKSKENKTV